MRSGLDIGATYLERFGVYFVKVTGVQDYESYTIINIIYPGIDVRKSMTYSTFNAGYKPLTDALAEITSEVGITV